MKKVEKFYRLKVAVKNGDVWEWNSDIVDTYRKYYYDKKQMDRFSTSGSNLYVWMINRDYLLSLVDAGEKVAGSLYVLALNLSGGVRDSNFRAIYGTMSKRIYSNYYTAGHHIKLLEKYLKLHALACGVWDDGIRWRPPHFGEVELGTLQCYYSREDGKDFLVIDDVVSYLRPYSLGVEQLFYKCVSLAGGESTLARVTAKDKKTEWQHQKAFERMGFKQRKNLNYYAKLFERYLASNQQFPMFDEKIAV